MNLPLNKRTLFICLLLLSAFLNSYSNFKESSKLIIKFYDIGQGDSTLLKFPDKLGSFKVLIDTGPDNKILKKLGGDLNPFFKRIDLVILSHMDKDHIGGALGIIRSYNVGTVLIPEAFNDTETSQELLKVIKEHNIRLLKGYAGDVFSVLGKGYLSDNATFSVLWPPVNFYDDNTNSSSLVPLVRYKDFTALFLGDLESDVSQRLNLKEDINIIKVPHHGSKGSFVDDLYIKTNPEVAIISVGKNNYGHPSNEVLDYFSETSLQFFRTDINGDIIVVTDGAVYVVKPLKN